MTGLELTVTLTPEQMEVIARRVAELLSEQGQFPNWGLGSADDLVPVGEAARMLGVSTKTVRNMLSDGRLNRQGAPRRPLVRRDEVEALRRTVGKVGTATSPPRPRPRTNAGEFSRRARERA